MARIDRTITLAMCPERQRHTKCPEGYVAWHEWATRRSRTHYQIECSGCGLLAIWVTKGTQRKDPK